ncbi:MAG: SDR family oxidoreductase [Thermoleophilaceae bacterium]
MEGLGRSEPLDLSDVDVVIHCAASVAFDDPLDHMLELNVLGVGRLAELVRAGSPTAAFVHVSTAYAAGMRTGLVLERPSGRAPAEPDVDLEAELDAARAWRRELEAESRLPEHQRRFVADAHHEIGPAGAPAVGARGEEARRAWVAAQLVERGRERCRALGWSDAYGFSKALGERALLDAGIERTTIVRPSIIESALRWPRPGWLEGLKVADPVILAYGRGLIPRFPANPAVRFDLIPVDFVANACLAAAAHPPRRGPRTVAVVSGSRRPLEVGRVVEMFTEYFRERPFPDEEGIPVEVGDVPLIPIGRAMRQIAAGERAVRLGRRLLDRVPVPRSDEVERRLHRDRRRLERLRRLSEIYGPYVELDCVFDDSHAEELRRTLHPDDRETFGFDPADIDWDEYVKDIHLPSLREMIGVPTPGPRPVARAAAERGDRRGTARPRLLRRRGRGAGDDGRALLRVDPHPGHAPRRPRAVDPRPGRAGAGLHRGRPPLALGVQPQLLPQLPRAARRRAPRAGRRGAVGVHPPSRAPGGDTPRARPPLAGRPGGAAHGSARLPGRLAAPPGRRDGGRPPRRAPGRVHRRAGRPAAHRRRAGLGGRAHRGRARRRPRRLPRLRRLGVGPSAARGGRSPTRGEPGLPPGPRGPPPALAGARVGHRAGRANPTRRARGRLVLALEYTPSGPRHLAARVSTRAGVGALRLEAHARPPRLPGPEWASVRPLLAGICGSDQALVTGEASPYLAALTSGPFVPGHEVVGLLTSGEGRGGRVVVEPALGCQARGIDPPCPECEEGLYALCRNVTGGDVSAGLQIGFCRDTCGGWSEGLTAHASQLHPIPDDLSDEDAVLVEPLACALHAARRAEVRPGQAVAVIGAGTIGLLCVAALRAVQPEATVLCVAKHQAQELEARRLGADHTAKSGRLHLEGARICGARRIVGPLGRELLLGGSTACSTAWGPDRRSRRRSPRYARADG